MTILAVCTYDPVDPDHRLVAAELERRWNDKLARVTQLEQAYARADRDAGGTITAEERAAIGALSRDVPALWQAETTTNRERKQLLRYAIETVYLDGVSHTGQIAVQVHWRSGTIATFNVARPAPGDGSLKTPAEAVALIRDLAATHTYEEIADRVNAAGWRTAFGRCFTRAHVGYICRRDGLGRGPHRTTPQAGERGVEPSGKTHAVTFFREAICVTVLSPTKA